ADARCCSCSWRSIVLTPDTLLRLRSLVVKVDLDKSGAIAFMKDKPNCGDVVGNWIVGAGLVHVLIVGKRITHALVPETDSELRKQGMHDDLIGRGGLYAYCAMRGSSRPLTRAAPSSPQQS